jgi:hypothetical protein
LTKVVNTKTGAIKEATK